MSSSWCNIFVFSITFRSTAGYAKLFFPGAPPASTVVEVSRMLPTDDIVIEVEATAYIPLKR